MYGSSGDLKVCPGFILREEEEEDSVSDSDGGVVSLMKVQNVYFGIGKFVVETEPNSHRMIRVNVSPSPLKLA